MDHRKCAQGRPPFSSPYPNRARSRPEQAPAARQRHNSWRRDRWRRCAWHRTRKPQVGCADRPRAVLWAWRVVQMQDLSNSKFPLLFGCSSGFNSLIRPKIRLIRGVANLGSNYLKCCSVLPGHSSDSAAKTRFSLYLGNSSGPIRGARLVSSCGREPGQRPIDRGGQAPTTRLGSLAGSSAASITSSTRSAHRKRSALRAASGTSS